MCTLSTNPSGARTVRLFSVIGRIFSGMKTQCIGRIATRSRGGGRVGSKCQGSHGRLTQTAGEISHIRAAATLNPFVVHADVHRNDQKARTSPSKCHVRQSLHLLRTSIHLPLHSPRLHPPATACFAPASASVSILRARVLANAFAVHADKHRSDQTARTSRSMQNFQSARRRRRIVRRLVSAFGSLVSLERHRRCDRDRRRARQPGYPPEKAGRAAPRELFSGRNARRTAPCRLERPPAGRCADSTIYTGGGTWRVEMPWSSLRAN